MDKETLHCYPPLQRKKSDTPRFLITLDVGMGDAIAVGLSAIDQIIENDPLAAGKIDVLCNRLQAQVFEYDPRINRIVVSNKLFFPGTHIEQWLRGITLDTDSAHLIHFLRQRGYEAIFPSIIAPGLYFRLRAPIMYPYLFDMVQDFMALRRQTPLHLSIIARQMVNHYFKKLYASPSDPKEIYLYIASEHIRKAITMIETLQVDAHIEDKEACQIVIVAPDTASDVTRPSTALLAQACSMALAANPNLLVTILPGYTDTTCSHTLKHTLEQRFAQRIFLIPAEPQIHLLVIAAFIDQADTFISGDTGVMHLAAAHKKLWEEDSRYLVPRNRVKIIALFGGTNPSYFGYNTRTTILGQGRKEQAALRPGLSKESYHLKGRDIFDHIPPEEIATAILSAQDDRYPELKHV